MACPNGKEAATAAIAVIEPSHQSIAAVRIETHWEFLYAANIGRALHNFGNRFLLDRIINCCQMGLGQQPYRHPMLEDQPYQ